MRKFTLKMLTLAVFLFCGFGVFAQTQFNATFNVDMTNADAFDPAVDEVWISGSFAGWTEPGLDEVYKMVPTEAGSSIFTLTAAIDSGEVQYKYFRSIEGAVSWDNGEWTGDPNRKVFLTGETTYENIWADKPYTQTFNVDMTGADPFDPAAESVYIAGTLANGWAQPGTVSDFMMNPTEDGSMIYTIDVLLYAGSYDYKYFRVLDGASWDYGEDIPNDRTVTFDTIASIVNDVWADINAGIFNQKSPFTYKMYPNPANSSLTLSNISDVNKIDVYDVTGKLIRTIITEGVENVTIDVADFNTGVYILNATNNTGVQTTKFVKK